MTRSISLIVLLFTVSARAQDAGLADKLRGLDARVYKPGSDAAKEAPDLVWKHLKSQRDKVNLDSLKWRFDTKEQWEALRDEKINSLRAHLGTFMPTLQPVPVHVTKTLKGEGFAIDNLVYQTRPGLWVTANLYRPDTEKAEPKSRPGILIIHSHHNPKTQGELQDMGMLWARAGCYVLVPDMLGHGERRQHGFHTEKDYPKDYKVGRQDYYFRYNSGLQLHLIGESLAGWMAWDLMRGLDMLLTKPGIDPERIALFGSVAGGGDPAAVTAALDPRIKVVAPFNFGGPQPETKLTDNPEESFNYMGGGSWESTRGLRGTGVGGFLPWVIVASAAPRYIIHAHEFAWNKDRDPAWRRYQKIQELYGAKDHLAYTHGSGSVKGKPPESTHCNNIGLVHRKMMHPAVDQWLGIKAEEYSKRIPSEDLRCWTDDLRLTVAEAPLHLVAANHASERRSLSHRYPDVYLGEWKNKVAPQGVESEIKLEQEAGKLPTRLVKFKSIPVPVPITTLTPKGSKSSQYVIALAQEGRAGFLKHRADAIQQMHNRGLTVVLVDLPATAETHPGDGRSRTSYATSVSALAQMLGGSLYQMRLQALNEVIHLVQDEGNKSGRTTKIALWGDSFAPTNDPSARLNVPYDVDYVPKQGEPLGGMLALMAPLMTDAPIAGVYVHGGLVNYASLLESPFLYIPHDAIEPGFLAVLDFDDLARRLAPRPLKLEALINGRNVPLPDAILADAYPRATQSYAKSRLTLSAQRSTDAQLAIWFATLLNGN